MCWPICYFLLNVIVIDSEEEYTTTTIQSNQNYNKNNALQYRINRQS